MLVPAGFVILVLLAVLSIDTALQYLARKELADIAASAANDAAVVGIDEDEYYRCGRIVLVEEQAQDAADQTAARRGAGDAVRAVTLDATVAQSADSGEWTVTILAEGQVDLVFSPAVAIGARSRDVRAVATSAARELGPAPAPPAPGC